MARAIPDYATSNLSVEEIIGGGFDGLAADLLFDQEDAGDGLGFGPRLKTGAMRTAVARAAGPALRAAAVRATPFVRALPVTRAASLVRTAGPVRLSAGRVSMLRRASGFSGLGFVDPDEPVFMDGMGNIFKKIGGGFKKVGKAIGGGAKAVGRGVVKAVKPVAGVAKFVGKAATNAALAKAGLGPIFDMGGKKATVDEQGNFMIEEPAKPPTNWTPWIIGGAAVAGLGAVLLLSRKKGGG